MGLESDAYLRSVRLLREEVPSFAGYPFSLPFLRHFDELSLHPKVTFFVGENGSGKSTLIEAIAVAWGFNPEGGSLNFNFQTRDSHSPLHDYLRLVRGTRKPKDGFFLRAESFYNLASHIEELDREMATDPPIIDAYGGVSLHGQSHGESFLAMFMNRFRGKGLYILDEPEAALSPARQMAMLSWMHHLVSAGSQFIIATHSPILMGYPDASIIQVTEKGLEQAAYEETEHYRITREFINNRARMLQILLES